jgi:hypothetical protein
MQKFQLTLYQQTSKVSGEWNFFATSHGKMHGTVLVEMQRIVLIQTKLQLQGSCLTGYFNLINMYPTSIKKILDFNTQPISIRKGSLLENLFCLISLLLKN